MGGMPARTDAVETRLSNTVRKTKTLQNVGDAISISIRVNKNNGSAPRSLAKWGRQGPSFAECSVGFTYSSAWYELDCESMTPSRLSFSQRLGELRANYSRTSASMSFRKCDACGNYSVTRTSAARFSWCSSDIRKWS